MGEKGESSDVVEEVVVMDTPVRSKGTQISVPPTKFEESPVFNFLNNLSPIKQVKSVHISQTINSLNFTSIPAIFASPHVATLKESRFLRRHQLGDPSKPDFSSDDVSKDESTNVKVDVVLDSENKENITPRGPTEDSSDPPYECSRSLNYDYGSPNFNQMTPCGLKTKIESDGSCGALVLNVQGGSDTMFHETKVSMEGSSQIDQNMEGDGCEWDNFISDTRELLDFDSPHNPAALKKVVDPQTRFYLLNAKDRENPKVLVGPSGQHFESNDPEDLLRQQGDGSELNEFTANPDTSGVSSECVNAIDGGPINSSGHETVSNLYRGMRRRCLVFGQPGASKKHLSENSNSDSLVLPQSDGIFELSAARKKLLLENSNSDSPILPQSDGNCISIDKQSIPAKFRNESSRCVLPGIGLHLNTLAATSKDYKVVKNETCASGKQLVITPVSASNHHLLNSCHDSIRRPVDVSQSDRQNVLFENGLAIQEDGGHVMDYMVTEELNQTSPKKKRRRSDSGEGDGCKRCNCKKSKCLKLYCECFAAGLYCSEPCSCIECFNTPGHEDTVLATRKQIESRNPLAFAPKVIRTSDPQSEAGDDSSKTPASARHKRGCNCKKSGCLKKYCECYQSGVGCSINCRCEGCKNAFGRKDGSEMELEDVDATPKSLMDGSRQRSLIQVDTEQGLEYVNPATPVPFGRPTHHLQFPSKNKPPRSTFLHGGSSSAAYSSQGFARPDFHPTSSKFDNNFGLLQEEDIPVVLQTNGSPIKAIKSLSPNGKKRVSPPRSARATSPSQRSSRKLLLQSIPSFPSLGPKNDIGVSSSEQECVPPAELH